MYMYDYNTICGRISVYIQFLTKDIPPSLKLYLIKYAHVTTLYQIHTTALGMNIATLYTCR